MKTMTRIKKTMLVLFAAMTMMLVTAGPSQAATLTAKQKIYKSYVSFLAKEGYLSKIDRQSRNMIRFTLGYYNNDNVPDLFVMHYAGARGYATGLIYTYRNGRVTYLGEVGGDVTGYYRKRNLFRSCGRFSADGDISDCFDAPSVGGPAVGALYRTVHRNKTKSYYVYTSSGSTKKISGSQWATLLKKKIGGVSYRKINTVKNNATNRKKLLGFAS